MSGPVAVAMSGGLDSSAVAWLLSRDGGAVIGLSMLLWDRSTEAVHGRCCGALDLGDARRVAEQCGIPHYTLRMEEEFRRQVVDPFVSAYLAGRTPVPCTSCNTWLKFGVFLDRARELGAERMATGHYARIVETAEGFELHAARHAEKDQSYYLFELTQEQLAASSFPLGEMTKEEVRRLAREAELLVAEKSESMELCFVSGGVREFVEQQAAERPSAFPVVAEGGSRVLRSSGEQLGVAEPYYRYTVGQRRGLGVAGGERLYVLEVRARENEIVVGDGDELLAGGLVGGTSHWIGSPPAGEIEATVRIRARHPGVMSRVRTDSAGRTRVEFSEPQHGVAPGQAAVFYRGSRVLGGCWIDAGQPISR
jgi:tRNA-specific 2-thiouridylase